MISATAPLMEMVCGYEYFWIGSELGSELVLNIILNVFWNGLIIIFVFGNHDLFLSMN